MVIDSAWMDKRRMVAILIGVALISGELFGLARTAERHVDAREDAQVPVREPPRVLRREGKVCKTPQRL